VSCPAGAANVALRNTALSISCDPATLELQVTPAERTTIRFSAGLPKPGEVTDLNASDDRASWKLADRGLQVALRLEAAGAQIDFAAERAGKLPWPAVSPGTAVKGWMLPLFEGVYVPAQDDRWSTFLVKSGPMNTTADLILPFWGLDCGDFTLTCILLNPFNNEVEFGSADSHLRMLLAHEFTRNQPVKQFALRIQVGAASPIEPARQYRRWLESRSEFVPLRDKIRHTPEAEKLLGAAHIYLWGDGLLGVDDVLDWKGFARRLREQGEAPAAAPGKYVWSLLDTATQEAVVTVCEAQWPDRYTKGVVVEALNQSLGKPGFFDAAAWRGVALDPTLASLTSREAMTLSTAELCRRNCRLLAAAFGPFLNPVETWGDGVSPRMVQQLAAAGFDRLWLGAEGWAGFVERPETVTIARERGFLIGTYDSYHSIHPPGEPDTWPTAQFDADLYRTGGIVRADGSLRRGFKGKGCLLSPKAARPYVEKRVANLMRIFHANSWFIDCDGFGQYFDDYSEAHPATQASDLQERMSRCAWIRDTYGAVIGSEGCSAGAAATLHFAHGVMTPPIGWGDPDLNSRESKYYLGSYYPPTAPAVFFKSVPVKEDYRYIYFNPRFRLPLFQAVFHDSVVATHHWGSSSLKFADTARTIGLLELLYNVPPLYHLNRQEFEQRQKQIKAHYDFFSPLHRELGLLPLTDFRWLTEDRSVQQTVFGDRVQLIANFGERAFQHGDLAVPPQSIVALWRDTGKRVIYTTTVGQER